MVVPIYKKWECNNARVQILNQDKVVQLAAFFVDFSHGKCMSFVLKGTDTVETFTRGGKSGVRILDAKFSLPKPPEEEDAGFATLDMPEYPSEHDDITILFDGEASKSLLVLNKKK